MKDLIKMSVIFTLIVLSTFIMGGILLKILTILVGFEEGVAIATVLMGICLIILTALE